MSSRTQTPSKGPPPLPTYALPDAPFAAPLCDVADDVADVEEAFFNEGLDGHADSVPNEPEAVTIALPPIGGRPVELETEGEHEADVEDPARARRRQLARIGVGWGAALLVGVAGTSAFLTAHRVDRSPVAHSASPAPVEPRVTSQVAASIAAIPPSQVSHPSPPPEPATAVTVPRSTTHAATASTKAVGASHPRAAAHNAYKKGATPSRGAKASAAPSKSPSTRARPASASSARSARTASKPPARAQTTAGASAKGAS